MGEVQAAAETGKKYSFLYIQSIIYVLAVYLMPVMIVKSIGTDEEASGIDTVLTVICRILVFLVPLAVNIMNIASVIACRKADRLQFLKCAMIIKYLLIPFYIIGGFFVAAAWTLILIPVPGLNFVGPFIGMIMTAIGYLGVAMASPFMIACLIKSARQKALHPALAAVIGIAQFIFGTDVLSAVLLSIKEKTWIKATIGAFILAFATVTGMILWIMF